MEDLKTLLYRKEVLEKRRKNCHDIMQKTELKEQIDKLNEIIYNYSYYAERDKAPVSNPYIEARNAAKDRLYGMGKLKRTLMTVTGQKKKFEKLWRQASMAYTTPPTQEEGEKIISQLDNMFR